MRSIILRLLVMTFAVTAVATISYAKIIGGYLTNGSATKYVQCVGVLDESGSATPPTNSDVDIKILNVTTDATIGSFASTTAVLGDVVTVLVDITRLVPRPPKGTLFACDDNSMSKTSGGTKLLRPKNVTFSVLDQFKNTQAVLLKK